MMRATKSRWISRPLNNQSASMLPFDHPALTSGNTIFPTTVRTGRDRWALKSAENTAKIGGEILKGKWAGFPAYTLTLEERADLPDIVPSLAILLRQQNALRGANAGGVRFGVALD